MTIIIFLLVLALLIFVHELGHFLAAKWFGVRVDEFALGFPPRIFSFTYGETTYALNLIPFGGYVKIFGEDPNDESISGPDSSRSLARKPKRIQAAVLVAGVTCNMILAWLLFSLGFLIGFPLSGEMLDRFPMAQTQTVISGVLPDSPAAKAGVIAGDKLVFVKNPSGDEIKINSVEELKPIVSRIAPGAVTLGLDTAGGAREVTMVPSQDLSGLANQWALGIGIDKIGVVRTSLIEAPLLGAQLTYHTTVSMIVGLADLVKAIAGGMSVTEAVVGPVGIAGMVGDATALGLVYLISFTAFISINLAILNLVPFPALDGGRVLFLLIEWIKGSPLNPKISNTLNLVGFLLLITFMLYVTWGDIVRLF